jgi:hypothetical protein
MNKAPAGALFFELHPTIEHGHNQTYITKNQENHLPRSNDAYNLQSKTNEELCEWIAGWNDQCGIGKRLLGQHELQRRLKQPDTVRSWIAIGISVFSVLLAILLHFIK